MTTYKLRSGIAVSSRPGWSRIRTALALATFISWGLVKIASAQVGGQIVQQFYVPFPETDFRTSLQAIAAANAVSNQIQTTISIVVGTTNTIIVYDHWEDGYENDLANPTQTSTQIWGDGNTNNGVAPGYPNDILPPGAVITLTNVVALPRNPSVLQYDGRDRIGATRAVTVTRAGWATNIGTYMATATEVYDTSRYGTYFVIPVGTNTTSAIQNFSYSSLHIIAAENGTLVQVDINGDGTIDVTNTLNAGESMFVNGGVLAGATVTASKPVQVHELTGRIGSNYQSRTFAIRPVSQWDTSCYAPVGTTSASYVHNVFVFNPYLTNITVLYSTRTTNSSFTVTNKTSYKFPMPSNSGAHFYTTNGTTFYAVGCNDSGSSTPGNNQSYDWGYALLPAAALTPVVIVGWAPGSDFTSGAPANGSPVWVTPTKATTIYVNYSGNYNTGPFTAPNGHHYDTNYSLVAYQFQTIYNATTKNMTGARIWTVDGTTFAAAWGEDPSTAGTGLPYMDAGTGIIPFPVPTMSKTSTLVVDQNGDGKAGWGDTLEYTVHVQNEGMLVLGNVLVLDALPSTLSYVTNSTKLNGVSVADNLVPPATTAFPLDESGLLLPQIGVGGYSEVSYRVKINAGATSISNAVLASTDGSDPVTSSETVPVAGPVLLAFTDASGNPVSSYVTNSSIYVTMTDIVQNTNASTVQTVTLSVTNLSNGDRESVTFTETGTNTGIFRNTVALSSSTTSGAGANNGTLLALAGHTLSVGYTDSISGNSGSAIVTVTAAPMPYTTKSSQLLVDLNGDGLIGWGDTVQYSVLLTNTSAQALTNLVVRDTLPANVSYVTNSTTSNGVAVADSGTTPFPLDESGLTVSRLATNSSTLLKFKVTVNSGTSISNSVTVTNLNGLVQAQDVAFVTPPPPSCNLSFTDYSGNPAATCTENAGVYVTITDGSQNTSPTNAQTVIVTITNLSGGDVESLALTETGTNTGVFRNTVALPTSTIWGTTQQDGTLNGHAGQVLSVYFTGSGGETCSATATVVPAVQTKKLYLSAVNAGDLYQNLNRIDPVAAGKTFTSNSVALSSGSSAVFAQTPAFCKPFALSAGSPVAVTNYVSILSGMMPASPAISAILKKGTNAANAAAFATLTNAAYGGGIVGWSGTLSTNVSFNSGETIFLVITSAQSGVSFAVQYNSASKPSAVSLPTTTVISLDQLGLYDAPYPAGNLLTNATNGQTVYIRATASDPFGAADVTKLSVVSVDPGGYVFTTNLTGAYFVTSNSCSSTYEYPWVTENWQGSYSILATAYEGTEGITNAVQTALQVQYPPGGTPSTTSFINSSGNPTNSYATNETVWVRVVDANMNQSPAVSNTVTVVITTTSGDSETITLTETGTNTGVFTGSISANTNAANPGNNVLNAPGGAGLTVTYTDPLYPSDTSSASAIVRLPPGPKPVVSLFKTLVAPANSTVLLGSPVQFNIVVANPGSVTATNVQLTDTFPSARLQFVSATIPPDSTTPAGTLRWNNIGPLAPGTNLIISTFYTAKMAGALTNSVSVTGSTNVGPVTAAATNSVSAIAVTKTLLSPIPGPAYINSNVVFRIAITNVGVNPISSYLLQDQFSSTCFQFLGASVTPSGSGGGLLLWTSLPGLAVGASTNIYVTNKVTGDCQPAVNNANISSVVDGSGNPVPDAQSSTSITNLGASISGTIWYDANANGTNDTGDSPLASSIVYVDLNGDGVRQGSEPFATTDTNGVYQIVSIPAGSYAARVDTNSLPAGVRPTYDLDGTNTPNAVNLTIANGQTISGLDFGYVGSGSINGVVWGDINGDGVHQAGELGIAGVNVFVDLNANGVREPGEPYIATASDGSFAFNYLVAGTYRIAIDILSLPPDMRPTYDLDGTNTPNVATVILSAGQNVTNANFGYQGQASLAGVITDVLTGLPIPGAKVVVMDSLGTAQTFTTSLSGGYNVVSLWTGPATVTVSKTGYAAGAATPSIVAGANTQNLGLTPNTLTGVVTDAVTTLPIAGATVVVTDSSNVVHTVSTDAAGHYGVTNLPSGPATLTASATGYASATSSPTINPGPNTQSEALTANTLAGVVTNTVSGLPIAGATVMVVDGANVTNTLTTDASGHYAVTNIAAGGATITASASGYTTATATPTIVAGANTQNLGLTANTLTGVVTDAVTALPIAGATVVVTDISNVVHTVTTDAAGHYGVTNLPSGPATLTASAIGYASATSTPTISPGPNTQNEALTANTLVGVVTNTVSGLPIAGATVMVVDGANVTNTLTTDASGHYAVTNIAAGGATITASASGYTNATASPTIVAGANTQNLGLTANTLTGVVTDAVTALPIAGATIVVTDISNVVHTVTTDAAGHYGVTNLPSGPATLTASAIGYASATSTPTISPGPNTQNEALTANTLAGVVTNTVSGLPIAGATLLVVDSANVTNSLSTDVNGHYAVTNIAAGVATLTASASGYTTATASPTIVAGANTQNLGLTANRLTGAVTDAVTALPIAGATVVVTDSSNIVHTVTTDAAGHYGVTNLPSGPATLIASATGYASATSSPTINPGPNTQDEALTANTLAGVVTNTVSGLPIAGATVMVVDSANVTNTLTTDASGRYAVTNIAAGVATLTASASGYTTATATPTIVAGTNTQDLGLTANTLTGVVTDAVTALPIAGATVVVTDISNVVHTVTTDAAGHYGVTNLPSGPAALTASATGYASATSHPTINPGPNTQDEALTANTLLGVVTNTVSGLPIAGATVMVVDGANVTNTLATDGSGHYAVSNIAAGVATITASESGYTTTTASPTIVAGTNTQDLGLTANTLTGVVTDAVTTLPIAGATVLVTDSSNVVHTVTTDAAGHYGVTNLPSGPATLTASAIGYASATSTPTISPGPNTQNEALTANTLAGVVTNTVSGLPIAGATLLVVDSANVTNSLTTDASGHYAVTNIAAGVATLTASASGYTTATATPTIVAGANTQDLGVTANTLVGVVTNTVSGLPIASATVVVVDSANVTNSLTTDASGHYAVTNIAAGVATITASASGYTTATASPTIVAGTNTQNLGLTANTLTGVVTDAVTALPIVGATVIVTDSSNVVHTVTTGAAGHYGVTNLPSGPATLTASATGYGSATSSPTINPGPNTQDEALTANTLLGVVTNTVSGLPIAGATVLVVDSANVTNSLTTDASGHYAVTSIAVGVATLTASASGYTTATATASPTIVAGANTQNLGLTANTLTGVVTDAVTALPIAGATVVVTDSSNVVHTVTTDAAGHYGVTNLPSGPATLTASAPGYASATSHPTINPGQNAQNEALTANTLNGVITDALTGQPIAGATVVVIDSVGTSNNIITGPTGAYSVSNIAAGTATITASKMGYSISTASPTIVTGPNNQNLLLAPNILAGQVTDAVSHQPIAGVAVQVVDAADITNTITTDINGYYGVTNIAAGAATVTASKTGYNPVTAAPTIVAGPNAQDLQLTASTPTLALLISIKAFVAGNGVLIRWQTASEVGSVSFDLYRQGPAADQWIKVNAEPMLAANLTTGSAYEVADAGAKPFTTLSYRLVELEEQGTTQVYGPFSLRAEAPALATDSSPVTEQATAASVMVASQVRVMPSMAQSATPLPLSALNGSTFVKITTTNSGLQSVTAAALATLLGQAQTDIQAAIAAGSLRLSNLGQPVAYLPNADGSALSFYAEPLKNNYTAQNVYWLTAATAVPLGSVEGQASGLGTLSAGGLGGTASYQAKLNFEQDLLAVPTLVQDPNQDYWMWQRLVAGLAMFDTATLSFAVDHLSSGGSAIAPLSVTLLGGSEATHTVQVTLNGTVVGQDTWQGRTPHKTVLPVSSSLLVEGPNSLTLKALPNVTATTSQWYLNGFGLNYPRQYVANGGLLEFTANSNALITVDGFANSSINVLDVTDPKVPAVVQHVTIAPTAAGYSATFAPANPQARFVAFQSGAVAPAAGLALGQVVGLSSRANAADYLIITPDSLVDGATTLASYRQQKGLRAAVVRLDHVYNEFSYGIPTPYAIRQFLATAVSQWSVKPRYAVLNGNGTYDYRDLLQQHDNLMPPLLVSTGYGLFCSDSAYGDINGDGQPEIAIGRLPVKTGDQLLSLINKIKAYEAQPAAAKAQSLLVADTPDIAGNFGDAIQQVRTTLAGSYSNSVIQCASQSDLGALRQAIQSGLNTGVDLVNYIGHGAVDRFGSAGYLTSADVPNLQNGARLPVVVAVTCVAGQYSVPGSSCLAENLLLQGQGGAVAVVAPTGLSVNQDASRLNLRLMQLLRANPQAGIGDLFRQALDNHVAQDNPTTQPAIYNLMGDPATTYNVALQSSSVPAAPRLTAATVSNGVMVITWSGGTPPYQLEKRSGLLPGSLWGDFGVPVTGTTATVPLTGDAGFIRVRSGN